MSGAMVSAVATVHVSLPRWSLLRGRLTRFRSAGARLVPVFVQDRRWNCSHQSGRVGDTRPFRREQIAGPDKGAVPVRLIRSVGKWVDQRLQLGAPIRETMDHPIPRETASWAYVFGSAAMSAFALQLVTGILLALI